MGVRRRGEAPASGRDRRPDPDLDREGRQRGSGVSDVGVGGMGGPVRVTVGGGVG